MEKSKTGNANYIIFRAIMMKSAPKGQMPNLFVLNQYKMLESGIRDVRIHDSACVAWCESGGTW